MARPEADRRNIEDLEKYIRGGGATAIRAKYALASQYKVDGMTTEDPQESARLFTETARLYKEAAEAGLVDAQNSYGDFLRQGCGVKQDLSGAILWFCTAAQKGNKEAEKKLSERSFTGRYYIEFRPPYDQDSTALTQQQIIKVVIPVMKSIGRAKTDASTIIGNLVQFSVSKGAIKTEADLNEIRTALIENNPGLDPEKSKSCLMIKSCINAIRARTPTISRTPVSSNPLAAEPDSVVRPSNTPQPPSPRASITQVSAIELAPAPTPQRTGWV